MPAEGRRTVGPPTPHPAQAGVRLDHVGVDVADLDRQTAFYSTGLDLAETWRASLPNGLTIVWLTSAQGWRLELFHRSGALPGPRRDADTQHDVLGIGHLALSCPSAAQVGATHDRLVALGAASLLGPGPSPGPAGTRAYVADPEGTLLELVHLAG